MFKKINEYRPYLLRITHDTDIFVIVFTSQEHRSDNSDWRFDRVLHNKTEILSICLSKVLFSKKYNNEWNFLI